MRLSAVSLATLSLSLLVQGSRAQAPSSGQAASNAATQQIVLNTSPKWLAASQSQAGACPVSLDVRHGSGFGQVIATDGLLRSAGQALDVMVTNQGPGEIASLDVIVQVRSGKSRMMPLVQEGDALGERLALHIDMTVKANEGAATSWNVASTRAVAYVELSKVTYRDGSRWSAAKGSACHFTPNPMMLISSR